MYRSARLCFDETFSPPGPPCFRTQPSRSTYSTEDTGRVTLPFASAITEETITTLSSIRRRPVLDRYDPSAEQPEVCWPLPQRTCSKVLECSRSAAMKKSPSTILHRMCSFVWQVGARYDGEIFVDGVASCPNTTYLVGGHATCKSVHRPSRQSVHKNFRGMLLRDRPLPTLTS